jgi:hypothetical protein
MNIDDLQTTWQSQEPVRKISIDVDMLLVEVRRNHRQFRLEVFWRDVREVVILLFTALFFVLCAESVWPLDKGPLDKWPLYMLAMTSAVVGVFMLIDRFSRKRKTPAIRDTLLGWAESSLADVEHQRWLLRNVFWWYLLPPGAAMTIFYAYIAWHVHGSWKGLCIVLILWTLTELFFVWVYRLNQNCVKTKLQTRRKELNDLVDTLKANN